MKTKSILVIAVSIISMLVISGCAAISRNLGAGHLREAGPDKPSAYAQAYSHYLAGTMYEREGQADKALEEIRKAAELAPNSATLTLRLIRAYLRVEDYTDALAMAERAVRQVPDSPNLWIVLGEIYHQVARTDDAVNAFKKAIELDPDNLIGYGALVTMEESSNDLVAAVDIYKRLAEMNPEAGRIHYQLGLCYARMNDPKAARAEVEKALQLTPNLTRANYVLGALCLESGDNDTARTCLEKYVEQTPDDPKARESLAGAYARLGQYPKAIEQLALVVAGKEPESHDFIELMYVLIRAEKYKEAWEAAPPSGAPALGALMRAIARKAAGEPYLPLLQTLDATDANLEEECTQNLNEVLYLFGKEEAGNFLVKAIEDARHEGISSRTVDFILARVLIAQDRYDDAEKVLAESVQRFPDDKYLHYCLAVIYEKLEHIPQAEEQLKAYLKVSPNDAEVLNFLGYLYAEHNMKLDDAETLLKHALDIDSKNGFYMDSLGWVYYRRGNADKAIELIKRAILAMDNDDAELRNHLGDAYLLKGDREKALAEWKRAQRLNPKLEGIQEKIDKHQK